MKQTKLKARVPAVLMAVLLAAISACGGNGYGGGPSGPPSGNLELNSGDVRPGAKYQHQFAKAGTFAYHCEHHPSMTGTVTVSDADLDTLVNVSITSNSAPFAGASVKTGGKVIWTNNASMVHTVTSN